MSKINKEIDQLLSAGVIDTTTAANIRNYYTTKSPKTLKPSIIIPVIGSLLIGAGLILLIAHNWEQLTRAAKLVIAFIPLIAGYIMCGYAIYRKLANKALNESAAIFTAMALGALLSLVTQTYNLPGNATSFIFMWTALSIPLVYLLKSNLVSLLSISGATIFMLNKGLGFESDLSINLFWLLLMALLPYYYLATKVNAASHQVRTHNWFLSLSIVLGFLFTASTESATNVSLYSSFAAVLLLIPQLKIKFLGDHLYSVLKKISVAGLIILLTFASFADTWSHASSGIDGKMFLSGGFLTVMVVTAIALNLLIVKRYFNKNRVEVFDWLFVPLFVALLLSRINPLIPAIIVNLLFLLAGIVYIAEGNKTNSYPKLNLGLTMVSILIFARFFDSDIPFMIRGLAFIAVGAGFLFTNLHISRKLKKSNQ